MWAWGSDMGVARTRAWEVWTPESPTGMLVIGIMRLGIWEAWAQGGRSFCPSGQGCWSKVQGLGVLSWRGSLPERLQSGVSRVGTCLNTSL